MATLTLLQALDYALVDIAEHTAYVASQQAAMEQVGADSRQILQQLAAQRDARDAEKAVAAAATAAAAGASAGAALAHVRRLAEGHTESQPGDWQVGDPVVNIDEILSKARRIREVSCTRCSQLFITRVAFAVFAGKGSRGAC